MSYNDKISLPPTSMIRKLFDETYNLPVIEAASVAQLRFEEVIHDLKKVMDCRSQWPKSQRTFHPNGFIKIELHKFDRRTLRLHLWKTPQLLHHETRIHGHAWAMASLVLRGRITHRLSKETASSSGEPYHRYRYISGTAQSLHLMPYDGPVKLQHAQAVSVDAGQVYQMERREIHSSIPTRPQTATLMFSDRSDDDNLVPIYSRKYFPNGYSVDGTTSP